MEVGDYSVGEKVPAIQAQGPELKSKHIDKKSGVMVHACNPSVEGTETGICWEITGQPAEANGKLPFLYEALSQRNKVESNGGRPSKSLL